jgi:hypothetical protein
VRVISPSERDEALTVRNEKIINGGMNETPRTFRADTGLSGPSNAPNPR